jgi:hypothetical protein
MTTHWWASQVEPSGDSMHLHRPDSEQVSSDDTVGYRPAFAAPLHWYSTAFDRPHTADPVYYHDAFAAGLRNENRRLQAEVDSQHPRALSSPTSTRSLSHLSQPLTPLTPITPQRLEGLSDDELHAHIQWCRDYMQTCTDALTARTLCCVCLESRRAVVFLPCKHEATCKACGEQLDLCPICRTPIHDRVVPYR